MTVAGQRRISGLLLGRAGRKLLSRVSSGSLALARVWPGRADRLLIAPHDLRTTDATRAAEIYSGRFVFAGKVVICHGRSVFELDSPSEEWEAALLGFGWLRHLRAAESAITRANARALVEDWLAHKRRGPVGRRADVVARRVISLLSQAPLVLHDADTKFYRRFLRGIARDVRSLRSSVLEAPDGVPRLQVLIARCYAALCLANQTKHIKGATKKLSDELQRQILPDGGHVSRNPGTLVELLLDLLPLRQTFAARNIAPPPALLNAIDRMMPMLRFFRHGDGSFALFNGVRAIPTGDVATLLAYDDTHGTPMAYMPHSGFQRLESGSMIVIADVGPPPPPSLSRDAHAGCLAFELSIGTHRLIVNCGTPPAGRDNWRPFARSTQSHSTLTYHEASSCQFVERSTMKKLLHGSPIIAGPSRVESTREVFADRTMLAMSHDGYRKPFGFIHRRVLTISQDGHRLEGEDCLEPAGDFRGSADDYAIRFHLHPSVKATRLNDGHGVLLVLPSREVWTFETPDLKAEVEDSVFLGGSDGARRTAQIVIRGHARQAATVRWSLTYSPGTPSATAAKRNARREPELPL